MQIYCINGVRARFRKRSMLQCVEFRLNLNGIAITGEAGWGEVDGVEHEGTESRNGGLEMRKA